MKNDIQIQQEVVAELDHEKKVVTGEIGVEVHHGVVKLAGHVSDPTARDTAKLVASGVRTVVMDVDIAGARSAPQPAGQITHGARAAQSK
jgi:osmotically-inducible protein OsmY